MPLGADLVEYLWENQLAADRHEAVEMGIKLMLAGLIRPAKRGYGFQDSLELYRMSMLEREYCDARDGQHE